MKNQIVRSAIASNNVIMKVGPYPQFEQMSSCVMTGASPPDRHHHLRARIALPPNNIDRRLEFVATEQRNALEKQPTEVVGNVGENRRSARYGSDFLITSRLPNKQAMFIG